MECKILLEEKELKNQREYTIDIEGQAKDLIILMLQALRSSEDFVEVVETALGLYDYEQERDEDILNNIN